jgi:hypothetical protein
MAKYDIKPEVLDMIKNLALQMKGLPQPINLLAVCTGGIALTQELHKNFKLLKVKSKIYKVWTNTNNKKCTIDHTDFIGFENNKGCAVIVEDVVWHGHHLPPIKKYIDCINPLKNKVFTVALFDCGNKCDFKIY